MLFKSKYTSLSLFLESCRIKSFHPWKRGWEDFQIKMAVEFYGDMERNLYKVLESAFVGLAPVSQSPLFPSALFIFVFTA